jgi:hypothetical protein
MGVVQCHRKRCNIKIIAMSIVKQDQNLDVSRHVLVSKYIYITDMFYGTEGVVYVKLCITLFPNLRRFGNLN